MSTAGDLHPKSRPVILQRSFIPVPWQSYWHVLTWLIHHKVPLLNLSINPASHCRWKWMSQWCPQNWWVTEKQKVWNFDFWLISACFCKSQLKSSHSSWISWKDRNLLKRFMLVKQHFLGAQGSGSLVSSCFQPKSCYQQSPLHIGCPLY